MTQGSSLIGDDDAKEKRDISHYVLGEAVHDADDIRREGALRPLNACPDLGLID